jgi:hypothetical protein
MSMAPTGGEVDLWLLLLGKVAAGLRCSRLVPTRGIVYPVSNLAIDPRTTAPYEAAVTRANHDPQVRVPEAEGPLAALMLQLLGRDETAVWISWAYEVRHGPVIWWQVALTTGNRLVGVGDSGQRPTSWASPADTWTVSLAEDGDCVLRMPAGSPLRIRGSGAAADLFRGTRLHSQPPAEATRASTREPDDMDVVGSWQEAEALAAWHMKQLGFDDAKLTPAGPDGGLDVLAQAAVAQVKHYTDSPIGAPAVQQLRGAGISVDWVMFYALSGYTRAALDFADSANVALFTYAVDGTVNPVSAAAKHLTERAGLDESPSIDEFALQREAKKLGQQLFDTTWEGYLKTAQQVMQHAQPNSPQTRALRSENDAVKGVLSYVDSRGTMKISEFMVIIDQIEASRKRLEQHLPWNSAR